MRFHVHAVSAASLAALVGVVLASSGCGEDVKGDVESLLDTYCEAAFRCCTRGEVDYLLGPFVSEADCKQRLRVTAERNTGLGIDLELFEEIVVVIPNLLVLERAIDEGRARLNEDNLAACKRLIREAVCAQEPEAEEEGCQPPEPEVESPCDIDLLVRGQVGHGGECTSPGTSFECKEGLTCVQFSSLGVLGACVRPGEVGDFCYQDGDCEDELYCSLVDGTCQQRRLEGEACAFADSDDPSPSPSTLLIKCGEGLSCDPVSETCVAPCTRGASCGEDSDCDIEAGLSCISGRCDVPRALGQPCSGPSTDCVEGLRCAANPADASELICQSKIATGESCVAHSDEDCESGYCDGSICQPSLPPGSDCPSFDSAQCAGGYCNSDPYYDIICSSDDSCPGTCNTSASRCNPVCIELAADGVSCEIDAECQSGACVDLVCRTLPLADGTPCTSSLQCESEFCNSQLAEPICQTLPLANGNPCFSSFQCESEVCFGGECVTGLAEGADCTSNLDAPCSRDLYCDRELTPNICVPKLPAGSDCDSNDKCHGDCELRFGRLMCDDSPAAGRLTCDGEGE